MKKILLLIALFAIHFSNGANVDTVRIYSNAMHAAFNCVVIKPNSYKKKSTRFSVVYLLHGYSGKYSDWIKKVPDIKIDADQLQILIVCPDGGSLLD